MCTILFVCSANVCRSQYARLQFMEAVHGHPLLSLVIVQSAGSVPALTAETCDRVAQLTAGAHSRPISPRALTPRLIARADLILTAEEGHRSLVARIMPQARSKTFTLVEASTIARAAFDDGYLRRAEEGSPEEKLRAFVARLNSLRGVIPLPATKPKRRMLGRTTETPALDIVDAHNLSSRLHARTLAIVDESVTDLVEVMRSVL